MLVGTKNIAFRNAARAGTAKGEGPGRGTTASAAAESPALAFAGRSGRPEGERGTCLGLWRHRDVRTALWDTWKVTTVAAVQARPVCPVRLSRILCEDGEVGARPAFPVAGRAPDPVLVAWCGMVQEHMDPDGSVFFSGSYSDQYGLPHGLMKARNVVKDFKRFLVAEGLQNHEWVCAVERHKYRDVLHLHALISGAGDFHRRVELEQAWRASGRGRQVTADPLLDGGVAYCSKYALKAQEAAEFDWSFHR